MKPWDDAAWGAGRGGEMFAQRLEESTVDGGETRLNVGENKGHPRGITGPAPRTRSRRSVSAHDVGDVSVDP